MNLDAVLHDVADAISAMDSSGVAFKQFLPGVGPYGEPQLVRMITSRLAEMPAYAGIAQTKRVPDLLIRGHWALEFKIARPFGNNGELAENWTVNLLHPYPGNVSALGDCLKLQTFMGTERRASIVVGYEHDPHQVSLDPLIWSFKIIAKCILHIPLGPRLELVRSGLVHPVHQRCRIFAWEVEANLIIGDA